jgi:hypothetical protein
MKAVMELFQGDAVKFFGIDKTIVAPARTELMHLEYKKNVDDWVFEADDKSFVHFEFQTTLKKDDLSRFMVSDAVLYNKSGMPVKTVVVYSGGIENAKTSLDCGSIKYEVDAFYLAGLDGDAKYEELRKKIEAGEKLAKQDLMSIVFLPLMKNSVDRDTRLEQSVNLSRELKDTSEKCQIQAMVLLLADKFIADKEKIEKLKEVLDMMMVLEVVREEAAKERDIALAKNAIKEGMATELIGKITGLETETIQQLKAESKA